MTDSDRHSHDPWERGDGETARAFDAFVNYRDLDPSVRSIRAACEAKHGADAGRSRVKTWQNWAATRDWSERSKAWGAELDRLRREALIDDIENVRLRHFEASRLALGVAMESLRRYEKRMKDDPEFVLPINLHVGMIREAAALERASRGMPT